MKYRFILMATWFLAACSSNGAHVQSRRDAVSDAHADGGVVDGDADDGGGQGDAESSSCGNGIIDEGEECDGTALDGVTCQSLGLPDGQVSCRDDCRLDTSACAVCGDGICSDGETAVSCVDDCGVVSIGAGRWHTCAVLADGSLWCWGAHKGHQMGGAGDTNVPVRLVGVDDALQVKTGFHHTCFVRGPAINDDNAELKCWGLNGFGECGQPLDTFVIFPPRHVVTGNFFFGFDLGSHHTCFSESTSYNVLCFGRGDYGNRGDGTWNTRQPVPTRVAGAAFVPIAGGNFTCTGGYGLGISCFGDNTQGQLGTGDRTWHNTPTTVPNSFGIPGLGYAHMCVYLQHNPFIGLYCTGSNAYGQLGLPASQDFLGINKVSDMQTNVIVGGYGYTCVTDETGHPLCWGDNYFGQLGDGTTDATHVPVAVQGLDTVADLSGGFNHVCAILPDHTARCWGDNRFGQLGSGSDERYSAVPVSPIRLGP